MERKSNDKKSYQYYFKKPQFLNTSKEKEKPELFQTQPYVKYERSQKLKSSTIVYSSNRSAQQERAGQTCTLSKRAGLYTSGYTPGKYDSYRKYYMSGDTEKRCVPKYIASKNTSSTPKGTQQTEKLQKIKQFTLGDQIKDGIHESDQQQPSLENKKPQQQNGRQENQGISVEKAVEVMDESVVHFRSGDISQKHVQLTDFINSTLGRSAVSWTDIKLVESTHSASKPSQLPSPRNSSSTRQDYFTQIQKFRQKLKQQQMKMSTMLTVKEIDEDVTTMNKIVQQKEKNITIKHVESKQQFLSGTPLVNSKVDGCKKCEQLSHKLTEAQKQIEQLYSKKHHAMEQSYKQYNTIKDYQQIQIKLNQQLQSKTQQINQHKITISFLQTTIQDISQQSSSQIKQLQQLKQEEINHFKHQYQKLLTKQKQTVGNYLSCITQLNLKIEQMDEQSLTVQKQLTQMYQDKIRQISQDGLKELQLARQSMEKQMQQIRHNYQNQIGTLQTEHSAKLNEMHQSYAIQMDKLSSQLQDVRTYSQQVPYLTEILVKVQSQLFLSLAQKDNLQTQMNNLLSLKDTLQRQNQTFFKDNQCLQNELNRLSQEMKIKQTELQLLKQNIGKLIGQNEQKSTQLERALLQLQVHRQKQIKITLLPEQQWSSFSPSTSIKQKITPTKPKGIITIEQQQQAQSPFSQSQSKIRFTELNSKYHQLQKENTHLTQQLQIASSQLNNNVNHISQLDELLAKCAAQIQSLQQIVKTHQKTIQEKSQSINQSQQIIVQLSDKVIMLEKKLYPSDQVISYPKELEESDVMKDEHDNDINMLASLTQQLQQKQLQIAELQQQLQQSLDIINLLKNQLTIKGNPSMKIFHKDQEDIRNSKNNSLSFLPNKLTIQVNSQQHKPQQLKHQHQQQSSHTSQQQNKQKLLKQYFVKIEEYYNQVLQIFGLEITNYQGLQLENMLSPMCTPRRKNPSLDKFKVDVDEEEGKGQNQSCHHNEDTKMKEENLTAFEHQGIDESHSQLQDHMQFQPQSYLPVPVIQPHHPLQLTFLYLSQNQQQVLKIINQWIRKLQRQSASIRQYKQKCHFLQQQISHLSSENNQLSLQKLQIYQKYQTFIVKLQAENNDLEEKAHMMGEKLIQLQNYVKELEEAINETNRECVMNGLMSLELRKEHSTFGRLIQKSIVMCEDSEDTIARSELRQSDVEEFYSQHELNKIISENNSSQSSYEGISSKDLAKSQASLVDNPSNHQGSQNQQEQIVIQMKPQISILPSNNQAIINNS